MRLIRTDSPFALEEFTDHEIPPYAILSHRWGQEEASFQEMIRNEHQQHQNKLGYKKIQHFCARAHQDGFQYAWIDTCCINRESSAELSEAINSMFRWYQVAQKCYAYLGDVDNRSEIPQSEWFHRGWTLQELIAPQEVDFLAKDWGDLGTRTELCDLLEEITGIHKSVLLGSAQLQEFSIAKRMSWAAGRETTRREDIAYCLMGIFNVNMPLLYGEGEKAFIRLQEEIMKDSDDQTIFVWENEEISSDRPSGLLARSPADFENSRDIVPFPFAKNMTPFTVTNRGIRMNSPLLPPNTKKTLLILECFGGAGLVGVELLSQAHGEGPDGQFVRVGKSLRMDIPFNMLSGAALDTIYVAKSFTGSPAKDGTNDDQDESKTGQPYAAISKYNVQPRGHHKKLILCFNEGRGELTDELFQSNVVKIFRMLETAEGHQLSYYQGVDSESDLTTSVTNGYKFITQNYQSDDEISLVGFSKGAYVAQTLAQIVGFVGIISPPGDNQLASTVCKSFEELNELRGAIDGQRKALSLSFMASMRGSFCLPVVVTFLGLFDAVNERSSKKHATKMPVPAHIIPHAVSIDERRAALRLILIPPENNGEDWQDIEEVWFPGTHQDMGNEIPSTANRDAGKLGHIPLVWMVGEATKAGVNFDRRKKKAYGCSASLDIISNNVLVADSDGPIRSFAEALYNASTQGVIHDPLSFDAGWSPKSVCKKRLTEYFLSSTLSRAGPREILADAAVHVSALHRMRADPDYRPPNLTDGQRHQEDRWSVLRNRNDVVGECYVRTVCEERR
ncbi:hypothetical protein FE257_002458 [Aspergillus nanangensis]|uniref:Heterokaryon incompatibility domain-containing protein n=1 Tax=Aspergillus nanangensis TaxID=2582783 RepID=A0AAD4CUP5_ASPNN|nr:hypothetical protein FE257_002458 [Aspergillus nanangensis]